MTIIRLPEKAGSVDYVIQKSWSRVIVEHPKYRCSKFRPNVTILSIRAAGKRLSPPHLSTGRSSLVQRGAVPWEECSPDFWYSRSSDRERVNLIEACTRPLAPLIASLETLGSPIMGICMGRENSTTYHSKTRGSDVLSLFDDANVSLTGVSANPRPLANAIPRPPSRVVPQQPPAVFKPNHVLPDNSCPAISITELHDPTGSSPCDLSVDHDPLFIKVHRRSSIPSSSLGVSDSSSDHRRRSSSISTLGSRSEVTLKLKSILKNRPTSSNAAALRRRSAVDFLEHAKENTLNFLIPTRQLDARRRALKKAYKWWNETEQEMRAKNPYNWLPRPKKNVHFEFDECSPFERIQMNSGKSSVDFVGQSSLRPGLPSFQLRRWQKIGRFMGVAMGLKLNARNHQSTSDPEIDTSVERSGCDFEFDDMDTISKFSFDSRTRYSGKSLNKNQTIRSLSLESLDWNGSTHLESDISTYGDYLTESDLDHEPIDLKIKPPSLSTNGNLSD